MHPWIQLPAMELNNLGEELRIKLGNRHQYMDPQTSIRMVELHVDSHLLLHQQLNVTTIFGGNP